MPIHEGKDEGGKFYQWGYHGKKYYYCEHTPTCQYGRTKEEAYNMSVRQAQAAYAHGYRGK